jgi:hypothetical protein
MNISKATIHEHTDPAQVLDKGRKSKTKEGKIKLKLKPQFT